MNLGEKTKSEKGGTFESNKSSLETAKYKDLSKKSESEKEVSTSESSKNRVETITESECSSTIFADYDNDDSAEAWDDEFEDDVFYADDENQTKCKKKQESDTQNAVSDLPAPQTSDHTLQFPSIQNIPPLPLISNTLRLLTISEESETTMKSRENSVSEEPELTITAGEEENNKSYEKVSKKGEKGSKKKHTEPQVRVKTEIVQKKTEAGNLKKLIMQAPLPSSFHTHILPLLKKIETEKEKEKENRIASTSTKLMKFPPVPITSKDEPHNTIISHGFKRKSSKSTTKSSKQMKKTPQTQVKAQEEAGISTIPTKQKTAQHEPIAEGVMKFKEPLPVLSQEKDQKFNSKKKKTTSIKSADNAHQKSTMFTSTSKTQKGQPHKRNISKRPKDNTLVEESFEKFDQTNLVLGSSMSEKTEVESVLKESKTSEQASSTPPVNKNLSQPVLSKKKSVQGEGVVDISEKLAETPPVSVIQEDKSCDKMPSNASKRPQKLEKTSQVSPKLGEASSKSQISTGVKTVPGIQFSEASEERDQTSLVFSKIQFIDPTCPLLKSATAQTDQFSQPSHALQKPNTSAGTSKILNEEAAVKTEPVPEPSKVTEQVLSISETIENPEYISPVALEDNASIKPVSKKPQNLVQQSPTGTGENIWDDFRIFDIKTDKAQSAKLETPMIAESLVPKLEPTEQSNEAPISEVGSSVAHDGVRFPSTTSSTEYIKTSLPFTPHFIEGATSIAAVTHNEYIRQVFMCEIQVYRAFKQHLPEEGHIRDLIGIQVYRLTCCTEEDCDQLCPVCEFCCHEYYCTCRPHILRATVWCIHLHAVIHKGQQEESVTFVMDKWQMSRSPVTHLRATCYDITNVTVSNENLFTIKEFDLLKAQVIRGTTLQMCDECDPIYSCSTCNICRHVYRCICAVFRRGELCEHCHVVALYQKMAVGTKWPEGSFEEVSNSSNVFLTSSENAKDVENDDKNKDKSPQG